MSLPRRTSYAGRAYPGPRVVSAGAVMTPARRDARMLLATEDDPTLHRLLSHLQSSAQQGRILEWSHQAQDLRLWQWPVHQRQPHAGSFVAPSGLRLHLAEHKILYPICLCARKGFATDEEAQTTILRDGPSPHTYRLVCAKHGTEGDCFYDVTLPRTPSADWRQIVYNPTFQFDDIGRSSIGYRAPDRDDDVRGVLAPRGLSSFNIEMPFAPPQAYNSAALVETRALMALNSPFGLKLDYLATLQRLLQYCNYCDVIGLPAAMRDHVETGNCRRFVSNLEGDGSTGTGGEGGSGSRGTSSSENGSGKHAETRGASGSGSVNVSGA